MAFSAPATLAGARGDQLTLENDVLRPDDRWSWQFKAAVWEPDRGPDGKMTLFAKRTGPLENDAIINRLMFKRTDDPFVFDVDTWETMFWNCQEPCTDPNACTPQELAECTAPRGYRLGEISLVDGSTSEWDYLGVLSWFRFEIDHVVAGATSVRIRSRQHVELKDDGGNWVRVPWGSKVDFPLERTVEGRIHGIFKVLDQDGRARYGRRLTGGGGPALFRRAVYRSGGALLVFGLFGLVFVVGPPGIKLLAALAVVYAVARTVHGWVRT